MNAPRETWAGVGDVVGEVRAVTSARCSPGPPIFAPPEPQPRRVDLGLQVELLLTPWAAISYSANSRYFLLLADDNSDKWLAVLVGGHAQVMEIAVVVIGHQPGHLLEVGRARTPCRSW